MSSVSTCLDHDLRLRQRALVFLRHVHEESHTQPPVHSSLAELCTRHDGIDAMVIENHPVGLNKYPLSSLKSLTMPKAAPSCPVLPEGKRAPTLVSGAESWAFLADRHRLNRHHHIGFIGLTQDDEDAILRSSGAGLTNRTLGRELAEQVHARGGAVVFNHPAWREAQRGLEYTLTDDEIAGIDAVEVANDLAFSGYSSAQVLAWVEHTFYARGVFPAIVSGLDEHGHDRAPKPTYTVAQRGGEASDRDTIVHALRAGRTHITTVKDLALDFDVDGYGLGQRPTLGPGKHVASVYLNHLPPGARLEVVQDGKVIHRQEAKAGQALTASVPLRPAKAGGGYVYLRVLAAKSPELLVATSAMAYT